ncbi:hypothetical protein CWC05_22065 [Pseudoalteromonas ruthenica]|uniref:Uncharacterized protein n=2 Tax=Pseudoalteromonas TaxID=53246 RepID=A0A5S3YKM3_9GAMM|nr:hypothetical protein CWC05_22065 [Pseudoalteromonas ruthenica]
MSHAKTLWIITKMNCSQHDYIEIACLYHYTLKVCTKKGTEHHGIAINTVYNEKNSSVYVLKMLSKNNSLNSIHLLKWMF